MNRSVFIWLFLGCFVWLMSGIAHAELIIYYDYEAIQNGIVPDRSGNGIDGQVNGNITLVDGIHSKAARFDQGSYLDLDGPSVPAEKIPRDAFSITVWINIEDTGGHHAIFNARASDEQWIIHPEARPTENSYRWLLRTDKALGGTIFDIRAGEPKVGEWVHFAGTYSRTDGVGILYIDGQEVGREAARIADVPVAGDWGMGARVGINIDDARPFTGMMDDFTIWNEALSPDRIVNVMANGPMPPTAVSPGDKLTTTWATLKQMR